MQWINTNVWRLQRFWRKKPLFNMEVDLCSTVRSTRSSSVETPPPLSSSLESTNRSFWYASPYLWNQLIVLFSQPITHADSVGRRVYDVRCCLSVCLSVCLQHNSTRRMAIANWTCVSWVAYAPGTIAVNVTWIEREFNAYQTPRSMYPSIFNHF